MIRALRAVSDENGMIKRNGITIKIWDDNSITRADVRLDLCERMTTKAAIKALGYNTDLFKCIKDGKFYRVGKNIIRKFRHDNGSRSYEVGQYSFALLQSAVQYCREEILKN